MAKSKVPKPVKPKYPSEILVNFEDRTWVPTVSFDAEDAIGLSPDAGPLELGVYQLVKVVRVSIKAVMEDV